MTATTNNTAMGRFVMHRLLLAVLAAALAAGLLAGALPGAARG